MTAHPKRHPALKHAGYSSADVLPGESASEFSKLHRDLVAELSPRGALEDEIVATIAHYLWRRKNLGTFKIAKRAQRFVQRMSVATLQELQIGSSKSHDPDEFERSFIDRWNVVESHARNELGELYALVEMGEEASIDGLKDELEVQSRLEAMIDRCIKRLLLVRGLKSMSIGTTSGNP